VLYFGLDVSVFLALYYTISAYGFSVTTCIGPSMEPTFNTAGDVVLVDKFSYSVLGKRYESGDVVIAICPYDSEKTVCKRVAGTEGEVIVSEFKGRRLQIAVPEGHVWLLGDNASNSTDSRYYGHVPEALLRGKVVVKLSKPFGQIIGPTIPIQAALPSKSSNDTKDSNLLFDRVLGNDTHSVAQSNKSDKSNNNKYDEKKQ